MISETLLSTLILSLYQLVLFNKDRIQCSTFLTLSNVIYYKYGGPQSISAKYEGFNNLLQVKLEKRRNLSQLHHFQRRHIPQFRRGPSWRAEENWQSGHRRKPRTRSLNPERQIRIHILVVLPVIFHPPRRNHEFLPWSSLEID